MAPAYVHGGWPVPVFLQTSSKDDGNRYHRVERFRSLPQQRTGVSEDDDSRTESNRVTSCPSLQKLLGVLASVWFPRYLRRARFALPGYHTHPRPRTISNVDLQCIIQPDTQRCNAVVSIRTSCYRVFTRPARQRFDNQVTSRPHLRVGRGV